MAKTKNRSEKQNFINKTNPQGEVPPEQIKAHLEKKIVEGIKQLAQGFTVSTYAIIELGKELIELEKQMKPETKTDEPEDEDF